MKKNLLRTIAVVNICLLHIISLILIVYLGLFRVAFMERECEKYQIADKIGISQGDLHLVLKNMIQASLGRDCDLDIAVSIDRQNISFFNERDKQHLTDISELSGKLFTVVWVGLPCLIVTTFYLIRQGALKTLCRTYLWSWVGWIGAGVLIGIFVATDLTGFINTFHRIFFQNNNWILNPAKDRLIWLFPKELFRDAAVIIAVCFTVVHGIFTITTIRFLKGAVALN